MVKPYKDKPDSHKEQVRTMFNRIAGRYDFLNHFLSLNIDRLWRRKLVAAVQHEIPNRQPENGVIEILDVATGTGDLAFALSAVKNTHITGLDLAEEMLKIAREKAIRKNTRIEFIQGDSENLPFEDETFHFVSVAFGVRNFEDLRKGLREIRRVLKPGGMVFILEFSVPPNPLYRRIYNFYSEKILPVLASVFSPDKAAYEYLPASVAAFPHGREMLGIIQETGFSGADVKRLSGGIASIYSGECLFKE